MYDRSGYETVPETTLDTLDNWAKKGWQPGSFCLAVLTNNLQESCCTADPYNAHTLSQIAMYVRNQLPMNCHGSRGRVIAWQDWFESEKMRTGLSDPDLDLGRLCGRPGCSVIVPKEWAYEWCEDCGCDASPCPHGNRPDECDECCVESDREYDAQRER